MEKIKVFPDQIFLHGDKIERNSQVSLRPK